MTTRIKRQPPEEDYQLAVQAMGGHEPGHTHYLLGAGSASIALLAVTPTGFVAMPPSFNTVLIAFVVGMLGGWVIREVSDRRFHAAATDKAWAIYHNRRRREWMLS